MKRPSASGGFEMSHSPLLWGGSLWTASKSGHLRAHLDTIPRERWLERNPDGQATLLHYACYGDNADAVAPLLAHGLFVDAPNAGNLQAVHEAACGQPRVLEALVAAGAKLTSRTPSGSAPLDLALAHGAFDCVCVLLANGVRLRCAREDYHFLITPEVELFEGAVLACRAATIVLLGLKRRRGDILRKLDRWVVREVALAIWCTRATSAWQAKPPSRTFCVVQ